jgi:hypothetical protein
VDAVKGFGKLGGGGVVRFDPGDGRAGTRGWDVLWLRVSREVKIWVWWTDPTGEDYDVVLLGSDKDVDNFLSDVWFCEY